MTVYELNDLEIWRERRAEMMREAERDRLIKELRASRKRRAGRTSALIWELKRLTSQLRKRSGAPRTGGQKTDE